MFLELDRSCTYIQCMLTLQFRGILQISMAKTVNFSACAKFYVQNEWKIFRIFARYPKWVQDVRV